MRSQVTMEPTSTPACFPSNPSFLPSRLVTVEPSTHLGSPLTCFGRDQFTAFYVSLSFNNGYDHGYGCGELVSGGDRSKWSNLKMKLSLARYQSMLTVQYCFLIVDLLINTFSELLRFESVILLVIFVWVPVKPKTKLLTLIVTSLFRIQDVCLVFSLIIVFLSFFSTYVFQVIEPVILIQKCQKCLLN